MRQLASTASARFSGDGGGGDGLHGDSSGGVGGSELGERQGAGEGGVPAEEGYLLRHQLSSRTSRVLVDGIRGLGAGASEGAVLEVAGGGGGTAAADDAAADAAANAAAPDGDGAAAAVVDAAAADDGGDAAAAVAPAVTAGPGELVTAPDL